MAVLESTASKPVTVRSNPPRFLRTGDKASVAAAFYNASDSVASVWGEMEIIDPVSGKVVASVKTATDELAASESGEMSVEFEVPDSLQYLLLRVYARSSRHSDGEQTLIQVLPSSTPVIESNAFYLSPGNAEFVKKLPAYNTDATLTLPVLRQSCMVLRYGSSGCRQASVEKPLQLCSRLTMARLWRLA